MEDYNYCTLHFSKTIKIFCIHLEQTRINENIFSLLSFQDLLSVDMAMKKYVMVEGEDKRFYVCLSRQTFICNNN